MLNGNMIVQQSFFFNSINTPLLLHSPFYTQTLIYLFSPIFEKISGDGNSGEFDLNAFGDWKGMYNVLGATGSGSSPGIQGSTTPAAYQTPHFVVDAYYRPYPQRYGQTPGLSQILKIFRMNTLWETGR